MQQGAAAHRLPGDAQGPAPKVACHYLLDRFRAAGIRRAFLVLHESKWDVARYFGTGEMADMSLAYLSIPGSRSVPETLDHAFPFVRDSRIALGFPDCLFEPADAYARLLERQAATGADLVLGLFPTERCRTTDMVDCGPDGRVRGIEVRPESTSLRYNWLIAVWTPALRFTCARQCDLLLRKESCRSALSCGRLSRPGFTPKESNSPRGGFATSAHPEIWRRRCGMALGHDGEPSPYMSFLKIYMDPSPDIWTRLLFIYPDEEVYG